MARFWTVMSGAHVLFYFIYKHIHGARHVENTQMLVG